MSIETSEIGNNAPEELRPGPVGVLDKLPDGPIGVVLAGAGARGAYEAGVLSVFLPVLGEQKRLPKIFVGASAGAINSVLFASLAHLPAESAAQRALATWRKIHRSMVLKPAWQTLPIVAARYLARLAGIPVELRGLLDTTPLHQSLQSETLLDWAQLHNNVLDGKVDVVSVVTTELGSNRTKVFFESANNNLKALPSDDERAVDFVRISLTPEHVLASAAIPAIFPPVRLGSQEDSGWHMDGGVRLNTPLRPALTFMTELAKNMPDSARIPGLVVVATDPARFMTSRRNQVVGPAPSVQDAIDEVLHGAASDGMISDLWNLIRTNMILEATDHTRLQKRNATKPNDDFWKVAFVFGGPPGPNELGGIAAETLNASLQGVRALSNPDLSTLRLLLSSGPRTRADLISYLFFEPEFIDAAIEQGQTDAAIILQQTPSLWRTQL